VSDCNTTAILTPPPRPKPTPTSIYSPTQTFTLDQLLATGDLLPGHLATRLSDSQLPLTHRHPIAKLVQQPRTNICIPVVFAGGYFINIKCNDLLP
jgi:hypothetical protein